MERALPLHLLQVGPVQYLTAALDLDSLQRPLGLDAEGDRVLGPPSCVGGHGVEEASTRRPWHLLVDNTDDRRLALALSADGLDRDLVQVTVPVVDEHLRQLDLPHPAFVPRCGLAGLEG